MNRFRVVKDRVPAFSNKEAFAVVESDLGVPFEDVYELVEPEPIAVASIGQASPHIDHSMVHKVVKGSWGGSWPIFACLDLIVSHKHYLRHCNTNRVVVIIHGQTYPR